MDVTIEQIAARAGVDIVSGSPEWQLRVRACSLEFHIVVPDGIYEWFVSAIDPESGQEVWSDWDEWYSVDGWPPESELPARRLRDVEYFISRILSATDLRIRTAGVFSLFGRPFMKVRNLEARIGGRWEAVAPGDLPEQGS